MKGSNTKRSHRFREKHCVIADLLKSKTNCLVTRRKIAALCSIPRWPSRRIFSPQSGLSSELSTFFPVEERFANYRDGIRKGLETAPVASFPYLCKAGWKEIPIGFPLRRREIC
jgi:hypothetical protein